MLNKIAFFSYTRTGRTSQIAQAQTEDKTAGHAVIRLGSHAEAAVVRRRRPTWARLPDAAVGTFCHFGHGNFESRARPDGAAVRLQRRNSDRVATADATRRHDDARLAVELRFRSVSDVRNGRGRQAAVGRSRRKDEG